MGYKKNKGLVGFTVISHDESYVHLKFDRLLMLKGHLVFKIRPLTFYLFLTLFLIRLILRLVSSFKTTHKCVTVAQSKTSAQFAAWPYTGNPCS